MNVKATFLSICYFFLNKKVLTPNSHILSSNSQESKSLIIIVLFFDLNELNNIYLLPATRIKSSILIDWLVIGQ